MQTLNLDDNIYILLLLGMIAVGAHAYSLFSKQPEAKESSSRWRALNSLPIQLVTSRLRFQFGFTIYLLVVEFIYLVLASSSSLLLMIVQMSSREDLAGALSENVAPNGAVPILASTTMILLSQIKPFASVELGLRAIAHRIARIPDGLKNIKQRVNDVLLEQDLKSGLPAETLARVEEWMGSEPKNKLDQSFARLSWIHEHTLGTNGKSLWDADDTDELLRIFGSSEYELMQLRIELSSAAPPSDQDAVHPPAAGDTTTGTTTTGTTRTGSTTTLSSDSPATGQWSHLLDRCLRLEDRLLLLLSLLIVNQPDVDSSKDPLLKTILERAFEQEQDNTTDVVVGASMRGAFCCFLFVLVYAVADNAVKRQLRQSPYEFKAPYGEYQDVRFDLSIDSAPIYRQQGMAPEELKASVAYTTTLFGRTSRSIQRSLHETVPVLITFLTAVMIALSVRSHHIRLRQWKSGHDGHDTGNRWFASQITRHMGISLLAASGTTIALLVYYFIVLAVWPALLERRDVLSLGVIQPFFDRAPQVLIYSLVAVICAFFSVNLSDTMSGRRARYSTPPADATAARVQATDADIDQTLQLPMCLRFALYCGIAATLNSIYLGRYTSAGTALESVSVAVVGFLCFFVALSSSMRKAPEYRFMHVEAREPLSGDVQPRLPKDLPPFLPGGHARETRKLHEREH